MRSVSRHSAWLFPAICLAIVLLDLADGNVYYSDVDDRMRALQIADLLADGDWFDRTLPFLAMPEAYVSPWSRLVDLPYAAVSVLLAPLLGTQSALTLATFLVPPVLGLAFAGLALPVMRSLTETVPTVLQLAATALIMTFALWEFTPGRIDHHNMQLLAMMAMLAGLCLRGNAPLGGAIAGLAITLSVAIGLECLPFIVVAIAVAVVFALSGGEHVARLLAVCGVTLFAAAPFAGLALAGPQIMLATRCDAWSAPWIAALMGGGIVLSGFALPAVSRMGMGKRFGFFGLVAVALVISLAALFPECLHGPYAMVNEAAREYWLDRVAQEASVISLIAARSYGEIAVLVSCCFIVTASAQKLPEDARRGDYRFALVWLVAFTALALAVLQLRFFRFAPAFVALLLPWFLAAASQKPPRIARPLLIAALALPAGAVILALFLIGHREREFDAVDLMIWDACEGADFSVLASTEAARITAPLGVSMPIGETIVKNQLDHTIAALPFHRAAPGISRVGTAFASHDAKARKAALAPFDAVAVCARDTRMDVSDAPLYGALISGTGWPGLEPAYALPKTGLHLYRIDHDKLR